MRQFFRQKGATVIRKTSKLMLYLVLAVMPMFLSGCAVRTAYKFSAKSVTQINYNPKNCTETFGGKFRCKDVVFTVTKIEPDKTATELVKNK
jgi:hypothetical protein